MTVEPVYVSTFGWYALVRRAGRTLVPAAGRAFGIVRSFFAVAAHKIARQRGYGEARARKGRGPGSGR